MNKTLLKKLPELLAPAGTPECAVAACDAGADAVYCGLGRFNARARAGNFTPESLGGVIDYLHGAGRKLYLTFNTLVKEDELSAAAEMLSEAASLGPDAVIVQDLGVLRLMREYFPELAIHASTQVGIHNSAGLRAAARLGVKRVILERQVTLDELCSMAVDSPVELEVFIHGSLCCSLSGRCLLSAFAGGWSGNRGQCRQLCRRSWHTPDGEGFALSPADLDGVSLLPELIKLKIASLKIEGRLRGPEYVWKTVRAYRLLLDGGDPDEARQLLAATVRRRGSSGFFFASGFPGLIDPARPGFLGVPVGKVLRCGTDGLRVRATGRIHLGDKYRLYPPDGGEASGGFELARLNVGRSAVVAARSGDECLIEGRFEAKPGWLLCKTGENGYDFSRRAAALPARRFPVDLHLELTAGWWTISGPGLMETWKRQVAFSPAERSPFTSGLARKAFSEGVPAPWRAGKLTVDVTGCFFVPSSLLKSLRREFWQWAAERLELADFRSSGAEALLRFYQDYRQGQPVSPALSAGNAVDKNNLELVLRAFVPESELEAERARLRQALAAGIRTVRVTALHCFELLRGLTGIRVVAEYPLPVTNSLTTRELVALGATEASPDPELDAAGRTGIEAHAALPLREPVSPPLLVTRLPLPQGAWSDRRGNHYRVELDRLENLCKLYAERPLEVESLH